MKLSEFRTQYPQYDDIDDKTLSDSLYQNFYSDMDRNNYDLMIKPSEPYRAKITARRPGILEGEIQRAKDIRGIVEGVGEAALATGAGMLAWPGSQITKIIEQARTGDTEIAAQAESAAASAIQYQPRTERGQQYAETVGKVTEPLFAVGKEIERQDVRAGMPLKGAISRFAADLITGAAVGRGIKAITPTRMAPVEVAAEVSTETPKPLSVLAKEAARERVGIVEGVKVEVPPIESEIVSDTMWKEKPVGKLAEETGKVEIHPEEIKSKWQKFNTSFDEFWEPLSTIPEGETYKGIRYRTMGDLDRAEGIAKKIWERTKEMPEETRVKLFRFLDGQISTEALPPEVKSYGVTLQTVNNTIGRMLVDRGLLSETTFEANKGQYVRYLYLKHILGDKLQTTGGGKLDLKYLKTRKDLTAEQKRAIGWVEDVSIAEPISVQKPLADIAKYDFLQKVADNPEWSWQPSFVKIDKQKWPLGKLKDEIDIQRKVVEVSKVPEAQARLDKLEAAMKSAMEGTNKAPEGFVQLSGKNYGPLDGAFVRKPIARDLQPVLDLRGNVHSEALDTIMDIERKGVAGFKIGKVALNLPTVVRNIISNIIQLNMSDIPLAEVPVYYARALESMLKKDQMWRRGQKNGLYRTNWSEGEIREVLAEVRQWEGKQWYDILSHLKTVSKYYGKIDDVAKLAKFIEQTEKGMPETTATLQAQKWGMDYSLVHPSVKWARQHIVLFGTYQYKIIPLLAESLKKNPLTIAKFAMIPYAMMEYVQSKHDLTDEEFKKLRSELPEYIKKNDTYMILPWKSKEGNWQWINLEYFFPWGQVVSLANSAGKYRDVGDVMTGTGIGNPYIDIFTVMRSMKGDTPPKDPFTNAAIYNQLDPPMMKMGKLCEWMYNKWAPSMLTRQGAAGYTASIGQQDKYGRTITPEQAAGRWVGVNIVSPTPKQVALERRGKLSELKSSLIRIMADPTISPERKRAAQIEYQEKGRKIVEGVLE